MDLSPSVHVVLDQRRSYEAISSNDKALLRLAAECSGTFAQKLLLDYRKLDACSESLCPSEGLQRVHLLIRRLPDSDRRTERLT
jgi:hypothetical protein